MAAHRFLKSLLFVGIPLAAIAALVTFWDWDWLIPIVQGRASSALGRQVTIAHLHVQLGRVTTVAPMTCGLPIRPAFRRREISPGSRG